MIVVKDGKTTIAALDRETAQILDEGAVFWRRTQANMLKSLGPVYPNSKIKVLLENAIIDVFAKYNRDFHSEVDPLRASVLAETKILIDSANLYADEIVRSDNEKIRELDSELSRISNIRKTLFATIKPKHDAASDEYIKTHKSHCVSLYNLYSDTVKHRVSETQEQIRIDCEQAIKNIVVTYSK